MHDDTGTSVRVAIVAASLRIVGGQPVQAQRVIDRWRNDRDVHAWLVPVNPVPRAPFDRALAIKYVRTVATQLVYWPLLVRELRRADVVHVFSASYASFLLSPLPAVVVAKLLGRPVVLNYHSGEADDHLRRSAIARLALKRWVDVNVVPSSYLRDTLDAYGIPSRVVANTIDLGDFPYRVRDPLRPRLLSTRNFERLYNVPCVLRAFAHVQARYPSAELTLVGAGSQDNEIRALAEALRLRHVTFTGRVAPRDMGRYYDDADIYIQAPSIDNMPLSVLEAFSSGLPVVSTDAGGVPAMLEHGVHGLLAPLDDASTLAAHVCRLLDEPDYARRLADAAYRSCAAYEWPVVRDGWLAVYSSVLPGKTGREIPTLAEPLDPSGTT